MVRAILGRVATFFTLLGFFGKLAFALLEFSFATKELLIASLITALGFEVAQERFIIIRGSGRWAWARPGALII